MLEVNQVILYSPEQPPQLIVVVDTEEEFDWMRLPDPGGDSITSIGEIYRVQEIFDEFGIRPCYVVDFPIASQAAGIENLKPILESGRCELGAHLHPWVNPPHREPINWRNTYPGNLGYELELEKLRVLTRTIEQNFDQRPEIYKAGRYGVGPHTPAILEELNYRIDLSVCSAFDYRADGGPDFSDFSTEPFWFGQRGDLLEIPLSGAFVGAAGSLSRRLYNLAGRFDIIRARGILSRLGLVDRLMLSPEGYNIDEHKKLTRYLLNRGVRTFTWNFHSPSVVPGMTMYTRHESDVVRFLDSFKSYFDFFLGELGGLATTPGEIYRRLKAAH